MTRAIVLVLLNVGLALPCVGQAPAPNVPNVVTTDVDHFWVAFDSVRATNDSAKQVQLIQTLYIDEGTPGLRAFMDAKGYSAEQWVGAIRQYPKFWTSVRPNTERIKEIAPSLNSSLIKLKALYPELRPAKIYAAVGALRSGGTTRNDMVLIGVELATGDSTTDISEFPESTHNWLATYFASGPFRNIVPLNVHEYVHTQEHGPGVDLLSQSLYEGVCDFVAELVTGETMPLPYMTFGPAHEDSLKAAFKVEMFAPSWNRWLYNNGSGARVSDLGYYMGYSIAKAYYQRESDKQAAVKQMIELDFTDTLAVQAFLAKSQYYREPLDRVALLRAYDGKRPVVVETKPFVSGDTSVSPTVQQLTVVFSRDMSPNVSIDLGPGGKAHYPIASRVGYSDDRRSLTFRLALKPHTDYEFILTDGGFRSTDGYPLQPYRVHFRTGE